MILNKLDGTDIEILKLLQMDNKQTIKDMAAKLNLSTTPIFERIKKLEKLGIIDKNIAVLNPSLLNLKLTAFISISVSDHRKAAIDQFSDEIIKFPQVMECHHITGNSDFLVKILVEDIEAYNEFLTSQISSVSNIAKIESSFSLSTRKATLALPL